LSDHPEVAVGAVVQRNDELLIVRRAHSPSTGHWSLPGGRVHLDETLRDAAVRETREETGIDVVVDHFLGWVERIGSDPDPYHFVILDFACVPLDPQQPVLAADDATEARWVALDTLEGLSLVPGLLAFLQQTHVLPSPETR